MSRRTERADRSGRIVVGFDGSDGATRALDWAAGEADRTGLSLEVYAAYGTDYVFVTPQEVLEAMTRLTDTAVEHVRDLAPDVIVKPVPYDGSPVTALIEASDGADLLVVGSRGLGGFTELALGSVGHKCALHAHCPVVVVRHTEHGDPGSVAAQPYDRLVIGVDGSPSSNKALDWAFREAERSGATVAAVTCWVWPNSFAWGIPVPAQFSMADDAETILDEALAPLLALHRDVPVETTVVQGHPSPVLIAESERASLLVVGSRGHGELVGALLGSVSEYCISHARCPVLVMRG